MAFNLNRWSRQTVALNTGLITVDAAPVNGPAQFSYASSTDNIATIGGANYFAEAVYDLKPGDLIYAKGSDASAFYEVATVNAEAGTITVVSAFPSGVIGTANINNLAVTTAKIDNLAVTTAKIDAAAVTSAKIDPLVLQYVEVDLSAANILAMYATPVVVLAAPGANTAHIIEHAVLIMDYNSAAYAAGGAIGLQYGNTANLAGEAASGTIAAANIQGTADTADMVAGVLSSGAMTAVENQGIYISNLTAAFTTGDSPFKLHIWYRTIPTV